MRIIHHAKSKLSGDKRSGVVFSLICLSIGQTTELRCLASAKQIQGAPEAASMRMEQP